MTQKTTTLAEKLESIKAALERIVEESEETQRQGDSGNYDIENDSIWVDAKNSLATLQELEKERASEETQQLINLDVGYIEGLRCGYKLGVEGDYIKRGKLVESRREEIREARKEIIGK